MIHLTQEHHDIREMVSSFAANELLPRAEHTDAGPHFPSEGIQHLGELGLLGAGISDRHGGSGGDRLMTTIILEELARGCPATALVAASHAVSAAAAIERFGSDEQKKSFLPRLAAGNLLATLAQFEADGEAVFAPPKTSATQEGGAREGGSYLLNGEKTQVIAACEAQFILVTARLGGDSAGAAAAAGGDSYAIFIVENPEKVTGVERKALRGPLGVRGAGFGSVKLSNCKLQASARLGAGQSSSGQSNTAISAADLRQLALEGALAGAAISVGLARAARDYANEYARKRNAFGGPINRFEVLRNYLAEAVILTDGARLLVYSAAGSKSAEGAFARAVSMAKVQANEAAYRSTKNAVQILGGNGYSREYPVERMYRDAKILEVVFVPNEYHRAAIADSVIGDRG